MPVAVIDVDGCVADLMPEWCRRWEQVSGHAIPADQLRADIRDCVVPEHRERIMAHLQDPDLYEHVAPVAGAIEGVRGLRALGFEIVFASLCTFGAVDQKARFLVRHGLTELSPTHYTTQPELFLPREFTATSRKDLIAGRLLVEDNVENATRWCHEHGGYVALIDYPYNRVPILHSRGTIMRTPTPPDAWASILELARKLC